MKCFWITALLALAGDVASKWATNRFLDHVVKLGKLLELRSIHNTGMALGIFNRYPLAGVLLPLAAILCWWWLMRRYQLTKFTYVSCGLIAGGFVGNYGQRILQGYVLDMIYFPWMPWFICNVADICICFGVALLAYSLFLRPQDWEEKTRSTEDAED